MFIEMQMNPLCEFFGSFEIRNLYDRSPAVATTLLSWLISTVTHGINNITTYKKFERRFLKMLISYKNSNQNSVKLQK